MTQKRFIFIQEIFTKAESEMKPKNIFYQFLEQIIFFAIFKEIQVEKK